VGVLLFIELALRHSYLPADFSNDELCVTIVIAQPKSQLLLPNTLVIKCRHLENLVFWTCFPDVLLMSNTRFTRYSPEKSLTFGTPLWDSLEAVLGFINKTRVGWL
jgi:hypothetical protein